jgi:hypothetical protein
MAKNEKSMSVELSSEDLLGSASVVELPERALMRHRRSFGSVSNSNNQSGTVFNF